MTQVLLVCMANVCRSPMACAVAQQLAQSQGRAADWRFASAGTHAQQGGKRMDARAQAALQKRRYPAVKTRSRQVTAQDFERFDLILAMDEANLASLKRLAPPETDGKLRLLLSFAAELGMTEVPDPYFGDQAGFERVLDLIEAGVKGLIASSLSSYTR
ncbi:low molecular weight phosphotyrosine protein phosphatase [Rhodoferax sp. 4810]|nr:low molecular weight phosphotyrosine protein phosphatase [Rhodoferax jenense]